MMKNNRNFAEDMTAILIAHGPFERVQFPIELTVDQRYEDIDILGMSPRCNNALKRNKIDTIGDLSEAINRIDKMRGCGVAVTKEIKNTFLQWYYSELESTNVKNFWNSFKKLNNINV